MKFEEAKPFLKEGMKVKGISISVFHDECDGVIGTIKFFGNDIHMVYPGSNYGAYLDNGDELEILTKEDGITPWEDPRKEPADPPKFKVGDRVRVLKANISTHLIGKEQIITKIENGRIYTEGSYHGWCNDKNTGEFLELLPSEEPKCNHDLDVICIHCVKVYHPSAEEPKEERPHYFVLGSNPAAINIVEEKIFSYPNYQPKSFKRKESKMNSVIQSLQAKLKPTDKTLVKHGYLNSDGTRTGMYEDQLREMAIKKLIDAEDTKEFRAELASELKEDDK